MKTPLLFAASALFGVATLFGGCSKGKTEAASQLAGEATFDPAPADQDTLEAQLKRYKGQTKFLNPYTRYGAGSDAPPAANRTDAAGGGRAIQESDIFKVGKPGSKLLFLLNNYRGLQVVSFADGADSPKLLGRAPATGNWPDAMYYDAARDRLMVLENVYESQDGDYYDYSEIQARLLTYDVSTPEKPTLVKTDELKGTLSESRMVGDVLYVATSVRPNWYERSTDDNKSKGFVYSFDLTAAQPALVQTQELSAPLTWGNQMNVVEVQEGEATKYYLIAVLSKDAWSWWDRQSVVEVVDISDAKGIIKPVMTVSAKGSVRERSQTLVKNRTLVVTSNFATEGATPLQRIAVETFKFPESASEIIDETEAEYRKLHVDRAVAKKEKELVAAGVSGDALADQLKAYREELLADAELGLRGCFVRLAGENGESTLQKKYADSVVTVGSTQGLNASLQDVRAAGDKLYVYWVPANNIDPLDVFDLAAPENGVRHLAHLEFDGWIQRAVPISYQGKQYVMGLGWIIPSVDNDTNRRYPQAVLFEIKSNAAGQLRAEVVAQKNLGASTTWADFNAEDKMIEVRFTAEGAGALMYTFASWDGTSYLSGGKLIGFDVSKVESAPDQVFVEGAVLKGDEGWLRRVFTNAEIERINTFSDQALGVFDLGGAIGAAGAIADATATLELARNIQSYASLTKDGTVRGIQIISDWSWYGEDGGTELRLVAADRADAEKGAALSSVKVPGRFIGSLEKDGALLVLTERFTRTGDTNTWTWNVEYFVHKLALASASELAPIGSASWAAPTDLSTGPRLGWQQKLVSLASGKVLAATSRGVKAVVVTADGIGVEALPFESCALAGSEQGNLKIMGGQLFVEHSVVVPDPAVEGLSYLRNFASTYDEATGACAAAVNIPGQLLNVAGGAVVTSDSRFIDRVQRGSGENTYYEVITESALAALKLEATTATLRDLYDPKDVGVEQMKVFEGDKLVFVESTATRSWWGGISDVVRPFPHGTRTEQRFVILGLDGEQSFTKQAWQLTLPLNSAAMLKGLLTLGSESLAVVGQGRHLAVLGFDGENRPTPKTLRKISASFEPEAETKVVTLEGYGWYWYGDQALHLTASQRTLEVPQGLFGVAQLQIVD